MTTIRDLPKPGQYVSWVRAVRAMYATHRRVRTHEWPGEPQTRAEFDAELRRALHRRISGRVPRPFTRKLDPMWQTEMARDARSMSDYRARRIRPNLNTREMRRRYAMLLVQLREDV